MWWVVTVVNRLIFTKKLSQMPKYNVKLVSDIKGEVELQNLVHGRALDEKRILCFVDGKDPKELFYVCDFSAEVFMRYTKKV
ncbi:hypothetical protein COK86_04330 [Bacillus cereus]|uniref:Uncharacterized protein n=2 Tax=Bacillus cereus TaxID=1396 RepID=A0A2B3UHL0_BACCE|nr:hypothetical protein COK86_04330 [Bacillus cereus]